jgi:protein-tyrosine phosphatase
MIDIHTHILPGVDDGAETIEDSIQMIQQAIDADVEVICATPHILDGVTPKFQEKINYAFQLLCSQIEKRKLRIKLVFGSEIYLRHDIGSLRGYNFYSLNQTGKYLLMELPLGRLPIGTDQLIRGSLMEGVTPIIAHPERCLIGQDPLLAINNMVNQGALIQINAGSILGHFGKKAKKTAERLLEHNLVHFLASDAHNTSSASITVLSQTLERLCQLVGKIKTEELVMHNPSKVLEGKSLWSSDKGMNGSDKSSLEEKGSSEISPKIRCLKQGGMQ